MNCRCRFCNVEVPEYYKFCPNCGNIVKVQPTVKIDPQVKRTQYTSNTQINSVTGNKEVTLAWYKFIIYFQLFASAIINVIGAIKLFSGSQYGPLAGLVYLEYPSLKTADTVIPILLILLAVFAIIIRFKLAQFKSDAPKRYISYIIAEPAVLMIYLIMIAKVSGGTIFTTEMFIIIAAVIAHVLVNVSYFKKREHLFVN